MWNLYIFIYFTEDILCKMCIRDRCYGDSNTWGLIPGTKERYPWGRRWTSILQEKLGNADVHVIEEGLCGGTTRCV